MSCDARIRITDPDDLSEGHLVAVLGMLHTNAWRWANFPELCDDDLVCVDWFAEESILRIDETPLVTDLRAEAARRGLDIPEEESS